MAILYVTEQGAELRRTGQRLIIQKESETLLDVPIIKVDGIMLFGGIGISTPAISLLLDNGIETAFFTLSGRLRGQLTPPKAKNNVLRFAQYDKCRSAMYATDLARELVCAKLENARTVVQNFRANHPQIDLRPAAEQIRALHGQCLVETNLDRLRGLEGAAAAAYFAALTKMLSNEFAFQKRQRRPPPDPVNALLSFTYVLLGNELQALLDGMGFDPYLGFFHALDYGRPSLSLDLLEPLRPAVADRLVLSLCNLRILQAGDFTVDARGAQLLPEARKVYFLNYDKWLRQPVPWAGGYGHASPRQVMRRSAEEMAAAIQGKRAFFAPRLKK